MPSNPEGLQIALARIAEEKEKRTGFLDLGMLGLEEWPEGLWELGHLTGLNLGDFWSDELDEAHIASSLLEKNKLFPNLAKWQFLSNLRLLSVSGDFSGNTWNDLSGLVCLRHLRYLQCANTQISSLDPLRKLQYLERLEIFGTKVSTLEPLRGLIDLQMLDCSGTLIGSLEPLAELINLQTIDCSQTPVGSLESLAGLKSLQRLDCSQTPVGSLESLAGLKSLQRLDCSITSVSSLEPLVGLLSLQTLNCYGTLVSSLEPLAGLLSLQTLSCYGTLVSSLEPLAGLLGLRALNCYNTLVSSLRPLTKLMSLQMLDCSNTAVGDLEGLQDLIELHELHCQYTSVNSLKPLAGLTGLQKLDCSDTQANSLEPLKGLVGLQKLYCFNTPISSLDGLQGLTSLQMLHCYNTSVSSLKPLEDLIGLQRLDCSATSVSSLEPLAGLMSLQTLNCYDTSVSSLTPLAGLIGLQKLYCSETPVSSLEPLARLMSLETLNCFNTSVGSLAPLAGLIGLQILDCSDTQVNSLEPLVGLIGLQNFQCIRTLVSSLEPLTDLKSLKTLNCSHTQVSSLEPLTRLMGLETLICVGVPIMTMPIELIWQPSLINLVIYQTGIRHFPVEVLSPNKHTNCLKSLRSHLIDLEAGELPLLDVKIMVLGNGRIGKTQICNRLRGEPFESESDSTHGITVTTTELREEREHSGPPCLPSSVDDGLDDPPSQASGQECPRSLLRLWDFGGQDIYHGTHALFMRSRALFLLVWTPASENSETHMHRGMTFRNQPLSYWLAYIRHLAGPQSPVIVVQNQCDRAADELRRPPVDAALLSAFPFCKEVHYSAFNERGRGAFKEYLVQGIDWLRETQGQASIGIGRLAVKQRIEAMQNADAETPEVSQRQHRTITKAHFCQICEECGGVSSPDHLLDYLHRAGIVFYQKGLFDDQIILDQAWALEAVYAVFNRERCFQQLKQLKGRFTRTLLEALVWQEHSVAEQKLFLTMMQSCGICFVHRQGDREREIETEYIAPDLLPDYAVVEDEVTAQWDENTPYDEARTTHSFMHPGIIRELLSRVGKGAAMTAAYWKTGVCLYEKTTRSHGRIEQVLMAEDGEWSGEILIRTQGGDASSLMLMLRKLLFETAYYLGCHEKHIAMVDSYSGSLKKTAAHPAALGPSEKSVPVYVAPPRKQTTYSVSYAWNDASTEVVTRLCEEAKEKHGVQILRDVTGLGLGESITKFMRTLTEQDRVFVILSGKYLKSPNCMYELWQVWMNCRADDETFRQRIRVYRLPDAAMMTPVERARCAKYWKDQFKELDELVRTEGADLLGEADFKRYKLMQDFSSRVGDILAVIADTLMPRDFADLEQYGFQ